ncbi:hypothetical protein [Microbulbifer sp. ZKSA002]|uniref:hypothetical protein n=1 Tax=Microbulbifer sp. ZKSA002 TaxID=3243388 RepID=UPI00403A79CC
MRRSSCFVSAVMSAIVSMNAVAAWDNGGVETSITDITVLQDGSFYISTADDLCDDGEVNKTGNVYLGKSAGGLTQSPEGVSMLLSTALSAQMAGKRVKIYADDSGSNWGCLMGAIKVIN